MADRERRPHYECDHKITICRDCDGSPPATKPWRTFITTERNHGMTTRPDNQPHVSPGRQWLEVANDTEDPYSMIGAAVTGLLAVLVERDEEHVHAEADTAAYDELDEAYRTLEAHAGKLQQVIDDIIKEIKPSTAKLSNRVREIVDEAFKDAEATVAEPVPDVIPATEGQPAADASLEDWRAYAVARGVEGAGELNRSQIRTALGLSHGGDS